MCEWVDEGGEPSGTPSDKSNQSIITTGARAVLWREQSLFKPAWYQRCSHAPRSARAHSHPAQHWATGSHGDEDGWRREGGMCLVIGQLHCGLDSTSTEFRSLSQGPPPAPQPRPGEVTSALWACWLPCSLTCPLLPQQPTLPLSMCLCVFPVVCERVHNFGRHLYHQSVAPWTCGLLLSWGVAAGRAWSWHQTAFSLKGQNDWKRTKGTLGDAGGWVPTMLHLSLQHFCEKNYSRIIPEKGVGCHLSLWVIVI